MGFERATLEVFIMIDVCGGMEGTKIAIVNETMRKLLPELKQRSDNYGVIIKLAVMQFSSRAEWITPYPVDIDDFSWNDLEIDCGSNLGEACRVLDDKLHKDEFLQDKVGNLAPVIILMSCDGEATDDFTSGLARLKENGWFRHARKIAVGFGVDANKDVLKDFTGNPELVLEVHTSEDSNKDVLKDFTGNPELVLEVHTSEDLKKYIRALCIFCLPPLVGVICPREERCGDEEQLSTNYSKIQGTQQMIIEQINDMDQSDLISIDGWE